MSRLVQFVRGALAAGLVGALVLALAVLVGLRPDASVYVYPAAAIGAVAFGLIPDRERMPQALGAGFIGLVALMWGVWSGLGATELSLAIGGGVAALVLAQRLERPGWLTVGGIALVVVAIVIANLIPLVLDGGGLGHDESAYALKARHWLEGTPETGWSLHRSIGMSVYGFAVLSAGGGDAALRMLGIASIIGLAAGTWQLGRRIGGPIVGPLAAMALVASPSLLRRSTEYLSDVPSAALLVFCMVIVWREFVEEESPTYRLLWMVPIALVAFYLRHQSVISFAVIAVMVAVLFWPKVKLAWRPIALAAGLGAIGLIPHFVFAISETGRPLGIITYTAELVEQEFFAQGLIDYAGLLAGPLAAYVGPAALVLFLWWASRAWGVSSERLKALFLLIPAAGQVLILGVLSHGESRFIFFPLALVFIGGATGFLWLSSRWRPQIRNAMSLGLVFVLAGSLVLSVAHVRRSVLNRELVTEPVVLSAETLRDMSGADECGVMTSYLPQITYYSACFTQQFTPSLGPEESLDRLEGHDQYMLLIEDGKRQPTGADLTGLLALTSEGPIDVEGERNSAEIFVFGP